MNPSHSLPGIPAARVRRGFTLVEVLVVITIIIVLAVIVVGITRNVKKSALKVADMANLRSLSTAAMAAGKDSGGRLPELHGGSYAPYWLVGRAILQSYGIYKEACYIPRKGVVGGAPNYDWWFKVGSESQVPVHYCYFASDTNPPWYKRGGNLVKPTKNEYRGSTPYETIIQDDNRAFPRSFADDAWYTVLWSSMISEFPGRDPIAPLVDSKGKPLGLNVIYLDGSAEWKDAKTTKVRYTHSAGLKLIW
jgi:prepilin-type N-terminal cleavage/methylation domain-containing protein